VDFETAWEEFGNLNIEYGTINLGSGFPNYESLAYLRDIVREVLDKSNVSIQATLPGMWERTLRIGSAGKSFSSTGMRV
jgi:hypothetical protein